MSDLTQHIADHDLAGARNLWWRYAFPNGRGAYVSVSAPLRFDVETDDGTYVALTTEQVEAKLAGVMTLPAAVTE